MTMGDRIKSTATLQAGSAALEEQVTPAADAILDAPVDAAGTTEPALD